MRKQFNFLFVLFLVVSGNAAPRKNIEEIKMTKTDIEEGEQEEELWMEHKDEVPQKTEKMNDSQEATLRSRRAIPLFLLPAIIGTTFSAGLLTGSEIVLAHVRS